MQITSLRARSARHVLAGLVPNPAPEREHTIEIGIRQADSTCTREDRAASAV